MKKYFIVILSILILFLAGLFVSTFVFSLEAVPFSNAIRIKTVSLGEYYTAIQTLELYEQASNKKVVSFTAIDENSRMHTVSINAGYNSFKEMYLEGYHIDYVKNTAYQFKKEVSYVAKAKGLFTSKDIQFFIPNLNK